MVSAYRLISEQQTDELRGLACHTANLKEEVVKGIIPGSEFNPKLAKHAQCAALLCFKSQSFISHHNSGKRARTLSIRATCRETSAGRQSF